MGSVSKTWAVRKCVHMHVGENVPEVGQCGLCDGSVRPKMCTDLGLEQSSSHFKSTEGGPQSKKGGGKTFELASTFIKRGNFKKGMTTPKSAKVFSMPESESKNPYRVVVSTPTKRKLMLTNNTQHLICKFEAKTGSDLPGVSVSSESPAKRRCTGVTGLLTSLD